MLVIVLGRLRYISSLFSTITFHTSHILAYSGMSRGSEYGITPLISHLFTVVTHDAEYPQVALDSESLESLPP